MYTEAKILYSVGITSFKKSYLKNDTNQYSNKRLRGSPVFLFHPNYDSKLRTETTRYTLF